MRKWKPLSCVPLFATPWNTVYGILQARILEWVAFPFSRGSSQPRDQTQISRIAGRFFTSWDTRASLRAQLVKNPPAVQETPVWFLGEEDPLEKG